MKTEGIGKSYLFFTAHGGNQKRGKSRKLSGCRGSRETEGWEVEEGKHICFDSVYSFSAITLLLDSVPHGHQLVEHFCLADPESTHFKRIQPLSLQTASYKLASLSVFSIIYPQTLRPRLVFSFSFSPQT